MTSTTSRLDTQYTTPPVGHSQVDADLPTTNCLLAPGGPHLAARPLCLPPNQVGFYDALGHGLGVVPGIPGTKRTYVKWRPYQERRATPQEVAGWLRRWPGANPLVVTGAVSGIIAVDMCADRSHLLFNLPPANSPSYRG